jgi:hypothetical protein
MRKTEVGSHPEGTRLKQRISTFQEANPMKLTYRGIPYSYSAPDVQYGDVQARGTYRGLDIRFRNPKKVPVYQPTLDLIYRGVAYQTVGSTDTAATAAPTTAADEATVSKSVQSPVATALDVQDRARSLMTDHHRFIKRRQQDMLSRLAAEVGLKGDDAASRWNLIQGKIHPTFRANYDRSKAAMS